MPNEAAFREDPLSITVARVRVHTEGLQSPKRQDLGWIEEILHPALSKIVLQSSSLPNVETFSITLHGPTSPLNTQSIPPKCPEVSVSATSM